MHNKTINLSLAGLDGNAFSLMGAFSRQAKKEKWTKEEIDAVLKEAQSGDYDHLLQTLLKHTQSDVDEPDSDDAEEAEERDDVDDAGD